MTNNDYDLCAIDKCNGKIFPESRLHCLHCEGPSCVNQSNTVDVRHPCVNYVKDDQCYSIFEHGKCFNSNLLIVLHEIFNLNLSAIFRWQQSISGLLLGFRQLAG